MTTVLDILALGIYLLVFLIRFPRQMYLWHQRAITPKFEYRKIVIRAMEKMTDLKPMEVIAGPGFVRKVIDKTRRRRMAVWNVRGQ